VLKMKRKSVMPERKPSEGVLPRWETFFMCQRNPMLRSQVLAALLSGTRIVVARLPTPLFLDVVLLGFAARVYCDAEIVDDWAELLRRTEEEWERPDWTCKVFSSLHAGAANGIVQGQVANFGCFDEQYIPDLVQYYLEHDLPEYFSREIEELPKEAPPRTTRKPKPRWVAEKLGSKGSVVHTLKKAKK
jgi:hypothetical protein